MVNFELVDYTWTFDIAAIVRDRIFGEDSLINVEWFF